MCQGWIKLHRNIMDKAIWKCSSLEQRVILITLLLMASHKENEWEWNGEKYTVKPGQFVTSLKSIAEKTGTGISVQNIRTSLVKFEKYGFLTSKSTNKNRLITIVNWELYQSTDDELTSNLTSNQQAPNKHLTTIKNVKNVKNVKKDYRSIYDFYLTLNLFHPRAYTSDMSKAIQKAMSDNKYTEEYCMTLLERHKEVVELTKDSDHPVKSRPLTEFFGQKAYQATHLICSEYEEGGKLYEKYLNGEYVPDELAGYNFKN